QVSDKSHFPSKPARNITKRKHGGEAEGHGDDDVAGEDRDEEGDGGGDPGDKIGGAKRGGDERDDEAARKIGEEVLKPRASHHPLPAVKPDQAEAVGADGEQQDQQPVVRRHRGSPYVPARGATASTRRRRRP